LDAYGRACQPFGDIRGGVDVITVDITVLDKDGRPVDDLKAGAASRQAVLAPERFFSTNSAPVPAAR